MRVLVTIHGESSTLDGRAAEIVFLIVRHAAAINAVPFGTLLANFMGRRVKLELLSRLAVLRPEDLA